MCRLAMMLRGCAVAVILLSTLPEEAWAKGKVDGPERTAKKACASGDFAKGVDILADLYVRTDDSTYIFNQGRCYEQNHQWTRAIDRFREFLLKSPESDVDARAEAEKHIVNCKSYLSEDESKVPAPLPAAPQPVFVPQPPIEPPSVTSPGQILAPPPSGTELHSILPTTGIVVGSVGLAGLVAAVVLNVKANDYADAGDRSNFKPFRNGALVCYGVGGAALATGAILYLIGHRKGDSQSVALVPTLGSGGGAVVLGGEF